MIDMVFKKVGGAEKEANALREKVLSADDTLEFNGRVFYVSNNGDDANDGLSPKNAVKTLTRAAELPIDLGDSLLLERGSTFRISETFWLKGGVSYGAYGEGSKPLICGSVRDYADASIWTKTEDKNIWSTPIATNGTKRASGTLFNNDSLVGVWKEHKSGLLKDGDFYHDENNGIYYLYFEGGNPGECFNNIEIFTTDIALLAKFSKDIKVDNIYLKYFTRSGMLFGECDGITVTNCVVEWLGGAVFNYNDERGPIRYGNAFETWYRSKDVIVKNCWFNQIFDAAVTFQGSGEGLAHFDNITFEDNLIEYCSMNIEHWVGNGSSAQEAHIKDITYKGNIVRMCGFGWGGLQRPDKEDQASILGWNRKYDDVINFLISDCILDCSDGCMIYTWGPKEQKGIELKNNSYYQCKPSGIHPFVQIVRGYSKTANNQEEFEEAIAQFDENPKFVKWIH